MDNMLRPFVNSLTPPHHRVLRVRELGDLSFT